MYSQDHCDDKENSGENPGKIPVLKKATLGKIINNIWSGVVRQARLGKRGESRTYYINLVKRSHTAIAEETGNMVEDNSWGDLENLTLSSRWIKVKNSASSVSLLRTEKWAMNGVRMITEITVHKLDLDYRIQLSSQGTVIENVLNTDLGIELSGLPLYDQLELLQTFLDNSEIGLCSGLPLNGNLVTHKAHRIERVNEIDGPSEERAFSLECSILSLPGKCCAECMKLKKRENLALSRKKMRTDIHPSCNDRWLSKEEIKQRMNHLRRELKTARQKNRLFEEQLLRMEESDSGDLKTIMSKVQKEDVPPEMTTLWQQQVDIMKTDSKHGYRWHPK